MIDIFIMLKTRQLRSMYLQYKTPLPLLNVKKMKLLTINGQFFCSAELICL